MAGVEAQKVANQKAQSATSSVALDNTPILKSISFWSLFFGILILGGMVTTLAALMVTHWTAGTGDAVLASNCYTMMIAISAVLSIVGGFITDKIGKTASCTLYAIGFVVTMILHVIMSKNGNFSLALLVPAAICFGFADPLKAILPPNFAGDYGDQNFVKSALYFQTSRSIGGAILPIIFGGMADASGSYTSVYLLSVILAVVGLLLLVAGHSTSPVEKARRMVKTS